MTISGNARKAHAGCWGLLTVRLIRSAGLRVETFSSAKAFLKRERPAGPACLVLDVRLPDRIPMSVQAMKAGALEFLTKPQSRWREC